MYQRQYSFKDISKVLKRRRWSLTLPTLFIFLITVLIVFLLKPVYRSTATILIEEQKISRDYVIAPVTNFAEQRLQTIKQRIMSSDRLITIINRFNLYADKRKKLTTDEIIENMRKKDIKLATIKADIVDRRIGRAIPTTIAFTISYEGENPLTVKQVANELTSLYLKENIRIVGEQIEKSTMFLKKEMESVQAELSEMEGQIAGYKEENPFSLPELHQYNLQSLDATDRRLEQFNNQLRTLKEKESNLESQISSIAPEEQNQDNNLLKSLLARLITLKSRYSNEYPDVKKTNIEIYNLKKKLLKENLLSKKIGLKKLDNPPNNPMYIALSAQLASTKSEISSVIRQINETEYKLDIFRTRLEKTPRVEEGYKKLLVKRNNTQLKYDDLMKKYMEARVAAGLESGNIGERFTLIDPARLPEKPIRPNRPAILLIGIILGISAGIGALVVQEAIDGSARGSDDLTAIFSLPVLAEIPVILTLEDNIRMKKNTRLIMGAAVFSLLVIVFYIHFLVVDLNVLWAVAVRRMAL